MLQVYRARAGNGSAFEPGSHILESKEDANSAVVLERVQERVVALVIFPEF